MKLLMKQIQADRRMGDKLKIMCKFTDVVMNTEDLKQKRSLPSILFNIYLEYD